jgi:hypothetical protein
LWSYTAFGEPYGVAKVAVALISPGGRGRIHQIHQIRGAPHLRIQAEATGTLFLFELAGTQKKEDEQ